VLLGGVEVDVVSDRERQVQRDVGGRDEQVLDGVAVVILG